MSFPFSHLTNMGLVSFRKNVWSELAGIQAPKIDMG